VLSHYAVPRAEVVSLAGGMPYVSALPRELVTGSLDRVMAEDAAMALRVMAMQYTPSWENAHVPCACTFFPIRKLRFPAEDSSTSGSPNPT
ncbi:hypothetical protein IAE22_34475, partial [Bacillus sp. S34]|nr:hypothetical protein [Bacillus sp. S34]